MEKDSLKTLGLFILTLCTTTIAGAEWMYGKWLFLGEETLKWEQIISGFQFSIPFLLILSVHEFGHYFTAQYHKINVTLPTYIPLWLGFIGFPSFGTMGAFIRIRETIFSRRHYFDVGVAGPLAGFVIAILVIWYGFTHLPPVEYIYEVHPEYAEYGQDYADEVYNDPNAISFRFGDNIIFWFFKEYVVQDSSLIPHPNEMIHYPFLLAGYLALFFTALNLLPIGQLDGGHVIFGLFGDSVSRTLNKIFFTVFLFYSGLGWVNRDMLPDISVGSSFYFIGIMALYVYFLYMALASMIKQKKNRLLFATLMFSSQYLLVTFTSIEGYGGWLLFAFIVGRFLGVYHPPVIDNRPLGLDRKILGWIAILVFILCFSPRPFIVG